MLITIVIVHGKLKKFPENNNAQNPFIHACIASKKSEPKSRNITCAVVLNKKK
jgi:hypothetical protein